MCSPVERWIGALLLVAAATLSHAQSCPPALPAQGAMPPGPLPVFPSTNWWNLDIRSAPVDSNSSTFIAFISPTRRLHPDFGGEESPGSVNVYGMPYLVVGANQPKVAVTFLYQSQSDGVDHTTGLSFPFYPIPPEAVTQPHWIEGGPAGNVDLRNSNDRHLLIIDCVNKHLYELYNVYYSTTQGRWLAGSGAFFDMNINGRRPEGWTSADAAGLAIFPGLVRYDEAWNAAVTDIGHALRVTVRATNGYVYPASHVAGSTAGALPLGARLRLKALVNGQDPALRSGDPNVRKIFRAMQKHGLIVADNGSDMYVTGTFDARWNNDILNPAFALLTTADFEVIQLGWSPPSGAPTLTALEVAPGSVSAGAPAVGTVSLDAPAPAGGTTVALSSSNNALASLPAQVLVAAGQTSAAFSIATSAGIRAVDRSAAVTIRATLGGVSQTAVLVVLRR